MSVKRALGVAGIVSLCVIVWIGRPRSMDVAVDPPTVCVYGLHDLDRAALVTCEGTDRVSGIVYDGRSLIAASDRLGEPGATRVFLNGGSGTGTLHIEKGWFGAVSYFYEADDGSLTQLKEDDRYLGGVVETLS